MNAIVVVPARDEARRIGACIEALATQTIGRDAFAAIVVLDDCRDDTRESSTQLRVAAVWR